MKAALLEVEVEGLGRRIIRESSVLQQELTTVACRVRDGLFFLTLSPNWRIAQKVLHNKKRANLFDVIMGQEPRF